MWGYLADQPKLTKIKAMKTSKIKIKILLTNNLLLSQNLGLKYIEPVQLIQDKFIAIADWLKIQINQGDYLKTSLKLILNLT